MCISLEGKMLGAACAAAMVGSATGNWVWGSLAGIAAGVALGAAHWALTQIYRIDHVISGMAINAAAYGATNYAVEATGGMTHAAPQLPAVSLSIGGTEERVSVWLVLALVLPVLLWLWSTRTRPGLRLTAVGSDPDKARLMGVSSLRVRLYGLLGTGVLTGLAGVLLLDATGRFTDDMTAGGGFIALAALILGGWRPIPAALGCLFFGLLKAIQIQLQGTGLIGAAVPSEVWQCVPYAATVLALALYWGSTRAPSGMGKF